MRSRNPAPPARSRGFTLIELMIVLTLIAILSVVAIGMMGDGRREARQEVFVTTLRDLSKSATLYHQIYQALPAQTAGDPVPPVLFSAIGRSGDFPTQTPIGGYWHVGKFADSGRWGAGVWWPGTEPDVEGIAGDIDGVIDDGDGANGLFQIRDGNRYYWLID